MKLRIQAAVKAVSYPKYDQFANVKGTIYLPTKTAKAIWDKEITGQLSDGMWENSTPQNHWRFWTSLESAFGSPGRVEANEEYSKGYNLSSLIPYVGDRMISVAKMALVDESLLDDADYMPSTFEEFKKKQSGSQYVYVREHLGKVSDEVAEKFYSVVYTEKDLRADLMRIKNAMKNQKRV